MEELRRLRSESGAVGEGREEGEWRGLDGQEPLVTTKPRPIILLLDSLDASRTIRCHFPMLAFVYSYVRSVRVFVLIRKFIFPFYFSVLDLCIHPEYHHFSFVFQFSFSSTSSP